MSKEAPAQHFYAADQAMLYGLNEGPLAGLRHRTVIDASTGAAQLALWQEEHLPGFRVPLHRHDCEEIITIIEGGIEAEIDGKVFAMKPGQSILIPAWAAHGFCVTSDYPVRLLAIFGNPDPKIFKLDGEQSFPPWEGGNSDHLS